MTHAAPPTGLNLALAALLVAIHLAALFAVPVWLIDQSPLWGASLAVPVLLTPTLWSLTHEAIHGSLFPARQWNDRAGRLLAGIYGAPFQVLRFGHLMHHRFNRTELNRVEVVDAAPPSIADRLGYYGRLFGGLYLGEIATAPLAVLPGSGAAMIVRLACDDELEDGRGMGRAARRQLLGEPGRSRLRAEGAAILAGLGFALVLWGQHWWMLAAALLARGVIVSVLDNVYHYGNALDEVREGSDLSLPAPLGGLLLNFNYHGTHHQRPQLPWTELPDAFRALERSFAGSLGSALVRQLRGPIPERAFDAGRDPGRERMRHRSARTRSA